MALVRFIFTCAVLGFLHTSLAQTSNAYYHFDNGDANDYVGNFHAINTTDLVFHSGTKNYVEVKDTTGVITLPSSLTDTLFSHNSMELSFDLRLTSGQGTIVMAAQTPISSAFWQNPGFSLSTSIGTTATLRFNFGDSSNYSSSTFSNLALDAWHTVQISIDLNTNFWKFIVDGQANVGSFSPGFKANEFKNAIKANTFTIGGINGSRWFPNYGQIDLDELKFFFPSPGTSNDVRAIYHSLFQDLTGAITLTKAQKSGYLGTLKTGLPFASYDLVKDSLFAYTAKYEELNPPLFINNGGTSQHILEENMPLHDQIMLFTQSHVFDTRFTPENIESVKGLKFEFGELFPGSVSDTAPRTTGGVVEINGTYNTDIAAEYGMQEFVVRPTGYYLAAGDTVTIEVPAAYANQGLSVVAGVHFRNLVPSLGAINRPRDVSLEFPIISTKTKIANPYGGGIYIKVPDGKNLGWFNVTINHAIKAPYFSWRQGKHTDVSSWLNEIQSTNAPWADFESDKYMFTIPTHLAANTQKPDMVMMRWDSIMDGFRIAGGRPVDTRIRAEFYIADRKLVTPAYGSGYPTVITLPEMDRPNSNWDPINVLTAPASPILMHEMGHTVMHPTMQYDSLHACEFEAETIVHVPTTYVNETVYNMTTDSAFSRSIVDADGLTLDEAAFDWIISNNFRHNIPMSYDTAAPMPDKEQLKYQPRGWAKYVDVARAYSWDTLSQIFGKYYTAGVAQSSTVTCNPAFQNIAGRDEFIQYASDVTGKNMAPLFHFWGINPTDSLANLLAVLPKSQEVKELIDNYFCKVAPQDLNQYTNWHNQMYARLGYQQPRYDKYLNEFDQSYANAINNQFALIRNKYGLKGPNAPSGLSASASNLTANLTWTDNSSDETGFVIRYRSVGAKNFSILTTTSANATNYTTNALAAGQYEFMIIAINSENLESDHCNAEIVMLTLVQNQVPVIASYSGITTIQEEGTLTLSLTDFSVTDSDNSYPTDFTLSVQSGNNYSVNGTTVTADKDYNGSLTVPVTVNDGQSSSDPFNVSVSVTAVNDQPIITSYSGTTTIQEEGSLTLSLTDFSVTDSDNSYPTDFTLSVQSGNNYSVNGTTVTADKDYNGSLTVPVTVNDGQSSSDPFNVSVSVTAVNDQPIITSYSGTTTIQEEGSLTLSLTDFSVTDSDNSYPTGFTLSVQSGSNYSVNGTTVTLDQDYNGSLMIPVTVNDGQIDSDAYNVSITVTSVNDKPVVTTYSGATSIEKGGSLTLSLTDFTVTDPDNTYPTDFTLTVEAGTNYSVSGSIVTPSTDFVGELSVPVKVNDGTDDSNQFTIAIEVIGSTNVVPAIIDQLTELLTEVNTPLTVRLSDLEVVDVDNTYPDDFTLIIQSGMNYTVSQTTVTPAQDFTGLLTVSVMVNDGVDNSNVFELEVEVEEGEKVLGLLNGEGISVHPNPSVERLTIKVDQSYIGPIAINMFDLSGKELKKIEKIKTTQVEEFNLNVTDIQRGVMLIKVKYNQTQHLLKVILE